MRVEGNFSVWAINEKDGRTSVRLAESRKNNQTGQYEQVNSFWATLRGDAVTAIQPYKTEIPAPGEHKRAPWLHFEGVLERRNDRDKDGNAHIGYITFFRVSEPGNGSNGNGSNNTAAPAAQPQATDEGGFLSIPDGIDEELPFC